MSASGPSGPLVLYVNIFKNILSGIPSVSNSLDLGPKCLQWLSADKHKRGSAVVECLTRDRRAAIRASLRCVLEQEH